MEGRGYADNYGRGGYGGGGRGRGRNGGGGGGGGARGGGGGRGRNNNEQNYQSQYNESGVRGGMGRGGGHPRAGGYDYPTHQQQSGHGGGYDYRATQQQRNDSDAGGVGGSTGRGVWTGKKWGPCRSSSSSSSMVGQPRDHGFGQPQNQTQTPHQSPPPPPPSADSVGFNLQSLKISKQDPSISSPEKRENKIVPLRRPDTGTLSVGRVNLLANHFVVGFNPGSTIIHYDVDIKQDTPAGNQSLKRSISKPILRLIKDQLFSDKSKDFPADMVAYDGEKNIFSAVKLPVGEFNVKLFDGEDGGSRSYIVTINEVNQLKLSKLKEYLGGHLLHIPRNILQGMDLVMKDNPSKSRITVGRSFYSQNYGEGDDLDYGVAAYRGFNQSLKPTSQGLALCLDYSVLALHKPLPVLDYLKETIENFRVNDVIRRQRDVISVLKGLKVRVTHRITKQKYTISGLSDDPTRKLSFILDNPDSQSAPREVSIVDYFWQKYKKKIDYIDIPCLQVGNANRKNFIPMEFCVLVEGQRYPKEHLSQDQERYLKKISLASPADRMISICKMVKAQDGPCGIVAKNFGIEVEKNMTSVQGRVLGAPKLKLRAANGNVCPVRVDQEKCHWNLVGKSVVKGQHVERWALIDFTDKGYPKLRTQEFINKLRDRSFRLGMHMEDPLACQLTGMREFSSVSRIEKLLRKVIDDASKNGGLQGTQLQVIVCVMTKKDPGYKYLKWVSETQIGVVTQCCLSEHANKLQDQYLANLCLKINAKVGGSNVELIERLPHFVDEDNVMFIGADVNHPAASNTTCPSIAAVVGTINWPATNRYAARVQPQDHRKEKIVNFGSICRDLVNTFAKLNNSRPKKIIVFRDGVSEGQFDMVLNEELLDLMQAIYDKDYRPPITLIVAQKRHHTRLVTERRDGGVGGNVPPGTVVDTTIVHPFEFDFYLCSHYGSLGTSKPTHYYVLWDQNKFTSDKLQKLIYDLCFTYARCTKPVSLVPPVYYADLVAYRGRLFQEVAMEQFPASQISSAMSSATLPSSAASFDQNFYTLHPDLQNMMFFV